MPAPVFNPLDAAQLTVLVGRESELNWEARDRLIDAITRYCAELQPTLQYASIGSYGSLADLRHSSASLGASGSQNNPNDPRSMLTSLLKINYEDILQILHTPRTQLSIRVSNFIPVFASFLGPALFDQFAENSLSHLLKLSGTTKKIIATAATNAAKSISALMLPQRAISVLLAAGAEKNPSVRKSALECLKVLVDRSMQGASEDGSLQRLWDGVADKLFAKAFGDANAEIRTLSVSIFCQFKERLPAAQQFIEKLDPSTKKQVNLALAKQTSKPAAPTNVSTPTPSTATASCLKSFIAQKQNSSRQSTPGRDESSIEASPSVANSIGAFPSIQNSIEASPSVAISIGAFPSIQNSIEASPSAQNSIEASPSVKKLPFTMSPLRSHSAEQIASPIKSHLFPPSQLSESLTAQPETLARTPHRKSPIKHAKSADSFLSSTQNSPTGNSKRQAQEGSPMKIDSVGNESVYLDAIESSDDEIILNVKNIVKLFNSKSSLNSPKYREILPEASSLSHFSSLMPSSQDTLLGQDLACPEVDELTMELPKKIFFHRSLEDTQPTPSTPPAQRVANLGLAASTPLRRLYRATSEPTGNPFVNHASEPLLNDLCAEFYNTGDSSCLAKINSIASKADQLASLSDDLVAGVLQTALKSASIEAGGEFISILMQKQALPSLKKSGVLVIELFEASNAVDLVTQLAQSALNPLMSVAVVQLCCQRVSEFRLQLLAQCIKYAVSDVHALLQSSLPPLLLSLNHPNAQIRRLAVSCFQVAGVKIGNESVLEAVSGSGIGDVPKRILSNFLAQR